MTSLDTCALHADLPSVSKASTSPLSVPTTTCASSAPGPAEIFCPTLIRQTWRPVAASTRTSVPSVAAAYTADGVMAGARPAAALPTLTCQLSCGVTFAVSVGNGPGLLLLPNSQPNDGGGIFGSDSVNYVSVVEQPAIMAAAMTVAAHRLACGQRVQNLMASRRWRAARRMA